MSVMYPVIGGGGYFVDLVEDKVEVCWCWDGWEFVLDGEVNEDVDRVGIYSSTFVVAGMEDGGTGVARKRVWLGWWWFGRVVLGGDWLGV